MFQFKLRIYNSGEHLVAIMTAVIFFNGVLFCNRKFSETLPLLESKTTLPLLGSKTIQWPGLQRFSENSLTHPVPEGWGTLPSCRRQAPPDCEGPAG